MSLDAASLSALNTYLADKSYIEGSSPSQADAVVFEAITAPPSEEHPHLGRWYRQIATHDKAARAAFPGDKKALSEFAFVVKSADEDEDDMDFFGSSDEEEDAEAARVREQRLAEYAAKKAKKPAVIAKSMITFDVKPWDDETDLKALEKAVRSIEMDGLLWGSSQLVPVGYGVNKVRIAAVVEDDKVSTDMLEEQMLEFEDYVQSVDIEAFAKI
ncbi:MAG: elongation factor 1 beta [Piptocephalis tieghemiana]|nr:MAG: elongation factor 1 beta [Piptocephalis tieghemiana]